MVRLLRIYRPRNEPTQPAYLSLRPRVPGCPPPRVNVRALRPRHGGHAGTCMPPSCHEPCSPPNADLPAVDRMVPLMGGHYRALCTPRLRLCRFRHLPPRSRPHRVTRAHPSDGRMDRAHHLLLRGVHEHPLRRYAVWCGCGQGRTDSGLGLIAFRIISDSLSVSSVGLGFGRGIRPVLWIIAESACVYSCVCALSVWYHDRLTVCRTLTLVIAVGLVTKEVVCFALMDIIPPIAVRPMTE
jgi:hypothetical protein